MTTQTDAQQCRSDLNRSQREVDQTRRALEQYRAWEQEHPVRAFFSNRGDRLQTDYSREFREHQELQFECGLISAVNDPRTLVRRPHPQQNRGH